MHDDHLVDTPVEPQVIIRCTEQCNLGNTLEPYTEALSRVPFIQSFGHPKGLAAPSRRLGIIVKKQKFKLLRIVKKP